MKINADKILKRCNDYLISSAGLLAFPHGMAKEITELYYSDKNSFLKLSEYGVNIQSYSHTVEINLQDLPKSYHADELEGIAKSFNKDTDQLNVMFVFEMGTHSPRGDFFPTNMSITFYPVIDPKEIDEHDTTMESYIQHELMHFVQFLLSKRADKFQSPPPKIEIPGYDTLVGYPTQSSPKEFNKLVSLLKDNKQALYELNPAEFYPKLNDALNRFLQKKYQTARTFKIFVGLEGNNPDYFFRYLKKFNSKLWTKAIKELWKKVEPIIR